MLIYIKKLFKTKQNQKFNHPKIQKKVKGDVITFQVCSIGDPPVLVNLCKNNWSKAICETTKECQGKKFQKYCFPSQCFLTRLKRH